MLEKYIRNNLLKNTILQQKIIYNIVKKEIFEITKKTMHYKLFYELVKENSKMENL